MEAKTSGVFSVVVDGDLDENKYRYEITRNGETYEVVDPFAYSSGILPYYNNFTLLCKQFSKK